MKARLLLFTTALAAMVLLPVRTLADGIVGVAHDADNIYVAKLTYTYGHGVWQPFSTVTAIAKADGQQTRYPIDGLFFFPNTRCGMFFKHGELMVKGYGGYVKVLRDGQLADTPLHIPGHYSSGDPSYRFFLDEEENAWYPLPSTYLVMSPKATNYDKDSHQLFKMPITCRILDLLEVNGKIFVGVVASEGNPNLWTFDKETHEWTAVAGDEAKSAEALALDGQNRLWIAASRGLFVYEGGMVHQRAGGVYLYDVKVADDGTVWACGTETAADGTKTVGLFKYDGEELTKYACPAETRAYCLDIDGDDIYMGGANALWMFRLGQFFAVDLDEATGIGDITAGTDRLPSTTQRYSITGQRVGEGYKGVVIQNGRKYVVR